MLFGDKDIRFTIEQANIAVYPPVYNVYLNYQILSYEPRFALLFTVGDARPEYNLGTLSVGT